MKMVGSQMRETLEESGSKLVGTILDCKLIQDGEITELYVPNDHYAGYVLEINGIGHEFVRTATASDLKAATLL